MENHLDINSEPFLTSPFGDQFLFSVNRNSFSKMGRMELYDAYFGVDYFKENNLYLIVGTDSGNLVNYFLKKGVPEGSRIVFLELPEVLKRLPEVLDMEGLPENMAVETIDSAGNTLKEFQLINYIFANRSLILKTMCTTDAFRPEYYELYLKIKTDLQEAIFTTRANLGDRLFMVRQLENLAENRVSTENIRNKFTDKTGIILAVGPSLEEAIPWVKENRDTMVVIAVSRAARKLYEAELVPDFIVTMDPSELSFDVSREMLHFFHKTVFIYGKHSTPLLLSQWRGRSLYLGDRFPWKTPLNLKTFGIAGPTVTQSALQAALEMGFNRILLAGVDLCFSREGYAYSSSVAGREKGTIIGDVPGGVETNGGWRAGTLLPYLVGARITEKLAIQAKRQDCEIINIAAGAMKMAGIDYTPPNELKLAPQMESVEKILAAHLPPDSSKERLAHYQDIEAELSRARSAVDSIGKLADEALQANINMFDPRKAGKRANFKRQMDEIEKKISEEFGDFPRVLKAFGILRFLRIIEPGQTDWSDERIEKTAQHYYEAYKTTTDQFIELIDRMLQRLKSRTMEETIDGDFNIFADQWEQDRQFGRALLWKNRNPSAYANLDAEGQKRLSRLETRFEKIMALEEDLSRVKAAPKVELSEIRAKTLVAFRQGQPEGLEMLANGLRGHEDSAAPALTALAQGYQAELQGNLELAFSHYQEVIDSGQATLTEDALARVAAISTNKKDYQTLKMALECLAGLNPSYAIQYGDLLWLLGDKKQTLDVYADYLEKIPGDIRALLQLGKYYLDLGAPEAARTAYEFVLEQSPGNHTAKTLLAALEQPS
ncbi:hypothetical protein A7E78_05580 [Syntrophotalea acetylenivorans]|uniref:6-hydroxymethylpterin diphosphokinase MptE-like domain-containing protein n=1 Tax=Syntrophotalea acetylenivorans TaxID=1842532 RepID=A0A1L3GNV8_9BACT|nr:6-hydroxymethylpterin diphosphokinase MptE-like protein [Syntrophotalea acetylenivorans]APG27358.1 hypothetical protein A7E78_05580 [Syntrophotalea acetylenivorans]